MSKAETFYLKPGGREKNYEEIGVFPPYWKVCVISNMYLIPAKIHIKTFNNTCTYNI